METNLTEIAIVALAALGFGIVLERMRQPAVLGYILAGLCLGPSCLGLIENRALVMHLAELGVLMLLFVVGMELNLQDFKSSWRLSAGSTLLQLFLCLLIVGFLGKLIGLQGGLSILLACAIAMSSTAIAVKMLESIGELQTATGRLTIGILIAQDLAIFPIILILRSLGNGTFEPFIIFKVLLSLVILAILFIYLGRGQRITLPYTHIIANHQELMPLAVLGFCFGMATITGLLGLSAAYGAFLAGLILGNSAARTPMLQVAKPIETILMMVFFLSIGLLLDIGFIWQNFRQVFFLLCFITLGKSLLNISLLHLLGQPWSRSFLTGLLLSQMGEFAFLLASIGMDSGLIDENGKKMVISLAALSLAFSPLWLAGARRLHDLAPFTSENFRDLFEMTYGRELHALERGARKFITLWKGLPRRLGAQSRKEPSFDEDTKRLP
jgi:CPA2 family monovalent cation:H+ antiporter-2